MLKLSQRRARPLLFLLTVAVGSAVVLRVTEPAAAQAPTAKPQLPRTADGKPNLQGVWQARSRASHGLEDHHASFGILPGRSVVEGGEIPYQDWAKKKRDENFATRLKADPLSNCYMPGVPRLMYMEYPFQIFQARDHVAMAFEFAQIFRLIYTNGSKPVQGIEFWMGDSRGRWEGDVLMVDVTNHNDRTWLDASGNFHSEALKVTERYTMRDADTIQYEATLTDPKVFTRPWKVTVPIYRNKDMDRVLEFQCNAEAEEANGAFPREPRTWYPK